MPFRSYAQGTKGKADISGYRITGPNAWQHKEKDPNPYQVEHDDLFHAIRNDLPYNEAEYGANSTLTAIMGRMATYSGTMIDWNKALNSEVSLAPSEYSWDAKPQPAVGPDDLYPMPIPGDKDWLKKII